jgi:serine/threonine-protein kinase
MDARELSPGDRLGPYTLEAVLGMGSVGVVFRAVNDADPRPVALKVLRPQLSGDERYVRRFLHEARAARDVEHAHLLRIVDAGEVDGRHFLVTPYVIGGSLDRRFERGGLPLKEVARVARDVGGALDALHRAGLVHRDVKPANVMLDADGHALLGDFGLARGAAYTVLTKPGHVVGTLDYLAPELIVGGEATSASDIYAFGCVVFECIAGSPPFAGRGVFEVGAAHLHDEPPDPAANRSDVPAAVSDVVLRALAKAPDDRPPSATAYAHMLRLAVSAPG